MAISAAERNRRKREKKKAEKQKKKASSLENDDETKDAESAETSSSDKKLTKTNENDETRTTTNEEYDFVPEPLATDVMEGPRGVAIGNDSTTQQENDNNQADENIPNDENDADDENDIHAVMRRFASRANVGLVSSDDEEEETKKKNQKDKPQILLSSDEDENESSDDDSSHTSYDSEEEGNTEFGGLSRRKLREYTRPTVAELKQRVKRPELVEAHDVTSPDPDFLLHLKSLSNTVPVPRHWGRKRKYLQGKRGVEKPPFQLPQFLINTGVGEARSAQMAAEEKMSLKQKQRSRVQIRGGVDVDYKTLHDAFFKFQTKPTNMTKFGDLYYEGKEYELAYLKSDVKPGRLSSRLRDALGMTSETSPPPWLTNMQRYGPPPSYPGLIFPGVNAPLPEGCSYGYHVGGWGKPPVDAYGRGLYGDVFGPPISDIQSLLESGYDTKGPDEMTGDGKRISKSFWGVLPEAKFDEDEEGSSDEEEESSEEEEESGEEESGDIEGKLGKDGVVQEGGILPPPPNMEGMESVGPSSGVDLRKTRNGEETPMPGQQKLYQVLETKQASKSAQAGALFQSDTTYVLPGAAPGTTDMGAESVLSKAVPAQQGTTTSGTKRSSGGDEDDDGMAKKFKF